jgi:peptidoglycan/LPS O-acetylase OafA/YrhL
MGTESAVGRGRVTTRDSYLDVLRVVAIAAVVVGHWLATGIVYQHGHLDGVDVLGVVAWTSWLTLVLQVVPVFFVVGGYANALSWTRYQATGGSPTNWIRQRALRLLVPTSAYIAVISLAVVVCDLAGVDHNDLSQAAWALALHLWFLAAYLALLVLTPTLYAAQRRFGNRVTIVMVIVAVVIDVGVIERHWHLVGWVNYVLVWGTFHQLGFAWHDGLFAGRRGRPFAFTAGALIALVLLIWWGPYPVSMVGVPGARIQNASPPSAALLAFGLTQVGIVLLVAPHARRWLQRADRGRLRGLVEHANRFTMPVYLWHMVPLVVVAVVAYPTHLLAQPPIGSGAWWAQRVVWVAMLVAVLAVTLAVLLFVLRGVGRWRRGRVAEIRSASKLEMAVLMVGIAASAAGLGRLAVQGFAPNGSLDTVTVIGFAVGVLLVWSGGRRYVHGEANPEEHS